MERAAYAHVQRQPHRMAGFDLFDADDFLVLMDRQYGSFPRGGYEIAKDRQGDVAQICTLGG